MPFLEGFNQAFFPVLLKHLEEQRQRERQKQLFDQFGQGTTETAYKPQGETIYGQPEGIGVRYPTTLPTVQPTQQSVPLDSPQFLNAAMQFLGGGGSQPDLNTLIQLRSMGLPQYTTTEGAQGQLLEQEKNRLTGQTRGVRQLTPPVLQPRAGMTDWTLSQGTPQYPATRKNEAGGYEQLYEKKEPNGSTLYKYQSVNEPPGMGMNLGRNRQLVPTDSGYKVFNKNTNQWEDVGGGTEYQITPAQVRQQAAQLDNVSSSIKEIENIIGRSDITGPVTGRARKLGSRFFSDTDAQNLINKVGQLRPIIYGLSGKQINEAELQWLTKEILPQIEQPSENFDVALANFKGWLDRMKGNLQTQFPSLKFRDESIPNSGTQTSSKFKILKKE